MSEGPVTLQQWVGELAEECIRCREQYVDDDVMRRTIASFADPPVSSDRLAHGPCTRPYGHLGRHAWIWWGVGRYWGGGVVRAVWGDGA